MRLVSRLPLLLLPLLILGQSGIYLLVGADDVQRALEGAAAALGLPYNTLLVLIGTALLGLASGVIGTFAVLRRRSLVGDAVAHASLPGLGVAFLALGHRNFGGLLLGAVVSGLLGALAIAWLQRHTRVKADAAIGIVLSVFYGLGIVISRVIQDDPSGRQAGLDTFLLGKTAGMVSQDIFWIAVVAFNVLLVVLLLCKEFALLSFDSHFAAVQGWPVLLLDALVLGLLVVTVVIGLPAVGVVLMAAMVILPGVSARFWSARLGRMLLLAALFGLASAATGAYASARYPDLPAGAVIVLAGSTLFFASMLAAPRRGIVARLLEELRFRRRVARENLLRSFYEATERQSTDRPAVTFEQLRAARSWGEGALRRRLHAARRRGEIEGHAGDRWRLSGAGLAAAAQIVKRHRLWEIFLVQQAAVAPDHVDRDADEIEHVVTPRMLRQLEQQLRAEGRWPAPAMPSSVHGLHPVQERGR